MPPKEPVVLKVEVVILNLGIEIFHQNICHFILGVEICPQKPLLF